jgi:photosystem II stability/assembly factor-like uncharacterized protein
VRRGVRAGAAIAGLLTLAAAGVAQGPLDRPALPSARAARTLLLDATHAGRRIVAVGDRGHVVLSDDDGETWRQAREVPTQVLLTGVAFAGPERGWAVGHDAAILHSRDGGERWVLQHAAPELESPLFAVHFADASRGLAVGAFGLALATTDGGATWERVVVSEGEDLHLNDVFTGRDGRWWIAAESGVVHRAEGFGRPWTRLETPYRGSYWGGLGLAEGGVLVFGLRGHVLRSDDRGASWRELASGTDQSLGGGTRLSDGSVVLAGLGGAIAIGRDGGASFAARILPDRKAANAVLEGAPGRLLLFGEGGVRPVD